MATEASILYTKIAAATILTKNGVEANERQIASVKIGVDGAMIYFKNAGREPRWIKRKDFKDYFVSSRQERAKELDAVQDLKQGHIIWVSSDSKPRPYKVVFDKNGPHCPCDDDVAQRGVWGRAMCKHDYRAIKLLGCNSLSEYVERWSIGMFNQIEKAG